MLKKPSSKIYLLPAVFVVALLVLIVSNVAFNSRESTEIEPTPQGTALSALSTPISEASPQRQNQETAFSALPTPSPVIPTQTPPADDPIGPMLPAQSVTLPLTIHTYLPAAFANYAIPPVYTYTIVHTYPHDMNAFTQGLVFTDGILYEGTGLYGHSSLRKVELETGNVLQIYRLPEQYFGEGITVYDDQIFQLTWKAHTGFVYAKDTFLYLETFNYPTEGWGITHDGERLIMSDGTATLHFLDPETREEIGQVEVRDNDGPVVRLNELEYIHGEVYANVWQTDWIARIDPQTGQVLGWINLEGLLSHVDLSQPVDVLNGIAYDTEGDRLFVTGKLWPALFEIELILSE